MVNVAKYSSPMDTLPKNRWTFPRSYVLMPSSPIVATFRDRCSVERKKIPPSRAEKGEGWFQMLMDSPFVFFTPLGNQHFQPKELEVWKMIFLFEWVIFRFHVSKDVWKRWFHQSVTFLIPGRCKSSVETLVFWSLKTPKCFVLFFCFPFSSLDLCSRFLRLVEISLWTLRFFPGVFHLWATSFRCFFFRKGPENVVPLAASRVEWNSPGFVHTVNQTVLPLNQWVVFVFGSHKKKW